MRSKIINFWYYNKTMVIVLSISFLMLAYMEIQYFKSDHADYDIGVVASHGLSEEDIEILKEQISHFGQDLNGDKKVVVSVHIYPLSLGSDNDSPENVGALDADLIGKVSGIFLLEDPTAFCEATSGMQDTSDVVSVKDSALSSNSINGLYIFLRKDINNSAYSALFSSITG